MNSELSVNYSPQCTLLRTLIHYDHEHCTPFYHIGLLKILPSVAHYLSVVTKSPGLICVIRSCTQSQDREARLDGANLSNAAGVVG